MHDAPDGVFAMIDMLASEYGWTSDYIKFHLPMSEASSLIHAILYRKGVKTFRRVIKSDTNHSLIQKISEVKSSANFDTANQLEGITF